MSVSPSLRALLLAAAAFAAPASAIAANARPVIVELFTSEGCSSCPPADALLGRLFRDQPVAGAAIIPLSLHVDYWNHLGWIDPFSNRTFSRRQGEYSRRFGLGSVYTPQMIVDGARAFVGSDAREAIEAVRAAAGAPTVPVEIMRSLPDRSSGRLELLVRSAAIGAGPELLVALTEDGLENRVRRGENAGRSLSHTAVVRLLRSIAPASRGEASVALDLDPAWSRARLRAVAFLQDPATARIVGAASAPATP